MSAAGGTPNYVQIPENLRSRFSELEGISNLVLTLADKLDQIHTLNKTAAGRDDAVAKAYHRQVDRPTEDMSTLVREIGAIFGVKAEAGSDAAKVLDRAEAQAQDAAQADWKPADR